jgi:hypothetical protein
MRLRPGPRFAEVLTGSGIIAGPLQLFPGHSQKPVLGWSKGWRRYAGSPRGIGRHAGGWQVDRFAFLKGK